MSSVATGLVTTVTGPVSPAEIGPTLMHEHAVVDMRHLYWDPSLCPDADLAKAPIGPADGGLARWYGSGIRDNLILDDHEMQERELRYFADAGGSCLVDVTSHGLMPDPVALRALSEATGLKIVAGTGYYTHASHPAWLETADVDEIASRIDADIAHGIGDTDVLPGIIGEVGVSEVLQPCEERSLRASARSAQRHGLAVSVHITSSSNLAIPVAEIVLSEGLDPSRLIVGHMDEILDERTHLALLDLGAVVEFDTFGFEGNIGWRAPTDGERLALLVRLIHLGYEDQLVVSQDVGFKSQLRTFGGLGYDHFLSRVAPLLESKHAVAASCIEKILVANPRRLLTRQAGVTP
jgi:phosphotriesterase-related protein